MESVKTKKATKMVAYKQLQERFASMVRRPTFRCKNAEKYFEVSYHSLLPLQYPK